ncbi:hypothetical protein EYV94_15355 [Puteibacter caeruleilacunae]|nr:hypothetical protein EYV94_15355 [Puteibacter caeruleilacunae]
MKKLNKLSLKEMENNFPVLQSKDIICVMGGYDPCDCIWRCLAYLDSCGTSYSAIDAENLASNYYGSSFDSTNYGFEGSYSDMDNLGAGVLGSLWDDPLRNKILVFDPNTISGWQGNGSSSHAVIIIGLNQNGDKWIVHDPQNGQDGEISIAELNQTSGYMI